MAETNPTKPKRTLENRMNDLSWKDWLKFQKSFFRYVDTLHLYFELVQFFTKRLSPSGTPSRVLLLSDGEQHGSIDGRSVIWRKLDFPWTPESDEPFDLAIADFRCGAAWRQTASLPGFYAACRSVLRDGGFFIILSEEQEDGGMASPVPWELATLARGCFRLRDEKIGLLEDARRRPVYVNILQAADEIGCVQQIPLLQIGAPATQRQWAIVKPKPRKKKETLHPAKFPEELIKLFIADFSDEGDTVLDPMGGTGSTAMAAAELGRKAVLIELSPVWQGIAESRLAASAPEGTWKLLCGDARNVTGLLAPDDLPVRYTITSPPYWRILHNPGMHVADEGQKARASRGLPMIYTDEASDLGNVKDYETFIAELSTIYRDCAKTMEPGSILTVITKNIKHQRGQYTIAWDLVFSLCGAGQPFEYAGTTFWCQDDVGLKPFGMGCDWISNILHNYCIHLRVRS